MACALNKHPHRSHLRVRAHHQVVNIQRSCSSSIPCSPTPRVRAQLVLSSPTLRSLRCPRRQPSPVSLTAKTTQLLPRRRLSNKPSTMVVSTLSCSVCQLALTRSLTHRVNLRVSRWPLCLTLTFSLAFIIPSCACSICPQQLTRALCRSTACCAATATTTMPLHPVHLPIVFVLN
jgi:hypothetical protein